ncbi:hypothetical protein ASG90_06755 [Nocardioides sp. Soil797]|nr:hypothetical protein ASG90_06755 [Nocardioides sp. Soil797]
MSTPSSRHTLRAIVLTAITALVAASIAFLATPAQASWTTTTTVHDAKFQLCRVKKNDNWKIKFRVDNRRAKHGHYGTVFRVRGGKTTSFRIWAKRGKFSGVETLGWRQGDSVDTMISERSGVGAGGGIPMNHIRRC